MLHFSTAAHPDDIGQGVGDVLRKVGARAEGAPQVGHTNVEALARDQLQHSCGIRV